MFMTQNNLLNVFNLNLNKKYFCSFVKEFVNTIRFTGFDDKEEKTIEVNKEQSERCFKTGVPQNSSMVVLQAPNRYAPLSWERLLA